MTYQDGWTQVFGSQNKLQCAFCGMPYPHSDSYVRAHKPNCHSCGYPYEGEVECGCKRHTINMFDDNIALHNGQWWALRCLFYKVDRRMPKILNRIDQLQKKLREYKKMQIKFVKMKTFMRTLDCAKCGFPVGNRFVQLDDGIYCGRCANH